MTPLTIHTFEFTASNGQKHLIAFNRENPQLAIRNVGLMVDGVSFTWYDASRLTKQINSICEFKGFKVENFRSCVEVA